MSKFRMQYKTVGLTYSRCPASREQIRDHLLSLLEITEYYIIHETHKKPLRFEGDSPIHVHAWFEIANKPNIRNKRYFDITIDGTLYHPNIGKKKKNWINNYLRKQDKHPLTNIEDGYVALAQAGKTKLAMEAFAFMHPKEFIINYDSVKRNIIKLGKKTKFKEHIYPFSGTVYEWDMSKYSLVIIDNPNKGKTEWAKSFIHHHLKMTYLRVTHIGDLKKYEDEDFIIYDDVDFSMLPRTTQIHIAEVKNGRSIHCRHSNAELPPGVKQIFVCNEIPLNISDKAIERRCHIVNQKDMMAPFIRFY